METKIHLFNYGSEKCVHVETLYDATFSEECAAAKLLLKRRRANKVEVRRGGWLMSIQFARPWEPVVVTEAEDESSYV